MFQPAALLKLTLLYGCFSRFLNCTNSTKSRNAPQIEKVNAENILTISQNQVNSIVVIAFI